MKNPYKMNKKTPNQDKEKKASPTNEPPIFDFMGNKFLYTVFSLTKCVMLDVVGIIVNTLTKKLNPQL